MKVEYKIEGYQITIHADAYVEARDWLYNLPDGVVIGPYGIVDGVKHFTIFFKNEPDFTAFKLKFNI